MKNFITLLAIAGIMALLLFGCQKQTAHTVTYQIEAVDANMEYRFSLDTDYIQYYSPLDSIVIVYSHENYTNVFHIYYHCTFTKDVMGTVSVKILLDGIVQDEFELTTDRCYNKTGILRVTL